MRRGILTSLAIPSCRRSLMSANETVNRVARFLLRVDADRE